jgi:hypothetical protein
VLGPEKGHSPPVENASHEENSMTAKYSKKLLAEFDRLTSRLSSLNQLERIEARLEMPRFVEKHGKEVCDAMFAVLTKRDNRSRS